MQPVILGGGKHGLWVGGSLYLLRGKGRKGFIRHHRSVGITAGNPVFIHDFDYNSEDGLVAFHRGIMYQTGYTGLAIGSRDVSKIQIREY